MTAKMPQPTIVIVLDEAQVNQVIKAASGTGDLSHRLASLGEALVLDTEHPQLNDRRLSRSLLTGLLMYVSFPKDGSSLGIKELSTRIKANPSTTHRYLTTLVAVGLLERDPDSRRYHLARPSPPPKRSRRTVG